MKILHHPDPVLRGVAQPVFDIQSVRDIVDQVAETMYAGDGIGLAAPQIGLLQRFVLVDHTAGERADALRVMINPTIDYFSPQTSMEIEGCLSLPGIQVPVVRSVMINVTYTSLKGEEIKELLSGKEARIAQHEIDHLNGVTLLQRAKRKK